MAYLCKIISIVSKISNREPLTSSSLAGATSTVCGAVVEMNKLKFQRRRWSGIGWNPSRGWGVGRRKSNKLRQRGDGRVSVAE